MQDFKHYKQGLIEIDKIKPYERNAKIHNSLQLEQIKNSILEFGFTNPLIVDSDFNLIAGHGRLEALKMLNRVEFKDNPIKQVNAVFIDGLSETQKRALIIADNKIAENAIWDEELLKSELVELENFSDILGDIDLKLDDDFTDINEKKDTKKSEIEFTEILDEEHNYVVLYFDNKMDWLNLLSILELKSVKGFNTGKSGNTKKIGLGRVVKGAEAIEKIKKAFNENKY